MSVPSDIDTQAIARISSGDGSGLEEMYDRHSTAIYSLALRIVRDVAEAEDVTQEVFTQVWTQAPRFDAGRGSVAAWMLMITRSRALDRLRRKHAVLKPGSGDHLLAGIPDLTPGVDIVAARDEQAQAARNAVAQLAPVERAAIELAYFEGLTHTEIAQRTGTPLGTVKTRIRSALRRVREAMTRSHTSLSDQP